MVSSFDDAGASNDAGEHTDAAGDIHPSQQAGSATHSKHTGTGDGTALILVAQSSRAVEIVYPDGRFESDSAEDVFGSCRIDPSLRPQFELAVRQTRDAEAAKVTVNEYCWRGAASVYALGCNDQWTNDAVTALCASLRIACTKSTLRNRFLPLVKATQKAAGCPIADKDASREARALQYMKRQRVAPEHAYEFLRDNGGIDGCLRLARTAAQGSAAGAESTSDGSGEDDDAVLSPAERHLIQDIRERAPGKYILSIRRNGYGIQSFSIEPLMGLTE